MHGVNRMQRASKRQWQRANNAFRQLGRFRPVENVRDAASLARSRRVGLWADDNCGRLVTRVRGKGTPAAQMNVAVTRYVRLPHAVDLRLKY
jgi:hypothetical protein